MRIKFINRSPHKGEAILLTDDEKELARFSCYAHTEAGKKQAIFHFEGHLLKMGKKQDEIRFSFTEVKE